MNKVSLALYFLLLTIAFQACTWRVAEGSTERDGAHLMPQQLQEQELQATEGKKLLDVQRPRRLGRVERDSRTALAHRGGSVGGGVGGGGGTGGRNVGGGASEARPHKKNGAVAQPVPMTSVMTMTSACGILLSLFSF